MYFSTCSKEARTYVTRSLVLLKNTKTQLNILNILFMNGFLKNETTMQNTQINKRNKRLEDFFFLSMLVVINF